MLYISVEPFVTDVLFCFSLNDVMRFAQSKFGKLESETKCPRGSACLQRLSTMCFIVRSCSPTPSPPWRTGSWPSQGRIELWSWFPQCYSDTLRLLTDAHSSPLIAHPLVKRVIWHHCNLFVHNCCKVAFKRWWNNVNTVHLSVNIFWETCRLS